MMLNTTSSGSAVDKPQSRKTESVAPMVESRITVVTWKRSMSMPIMIVAKTAAPFSSATSREPVAGERPRCAAKVGR